MSGDGTNFAIVATGRKRSGKSHQINAIGERFPHRIIFDHIGEFAGKVPGAVEVYSLDDAVAALARLRTVPKWALLCIIQPGDAIKLIEIIAPFGQRAERSYSFAVGGVTIEDGEVDLIAPNHSGINPSVLNLWARGRHYRVNPLVGTVRPREMHRVITSQSDVVLAFKQQEPADKEYLGRLIRSDVPRLLSRIPYRHFLRYFVQSEALEMVTDAGAASLVPDPNAEEKEISASSIPAPVSENSDSDIAERPKTARRKRSAEPETPLP